MGVLQRFEHRVEELVSGAFARAFRAQLQPVEIAAALQHECDEQAAIVSRENTMVPNRFVVTLAPQDHDRLSGYATVLVEELATVVREHADEQGYTLVGPVDISFEADPDLPTGRLRVRSEAVAAIRTGQSATGGRDRPYGEVPPGAPGAGGEGEAYLEVGGRRYPLAGRVTLIGRGEDADLHIEDPAISRRHAELRVDGPLAEIVDLGSTNGLVVDGQRVERAALVDGTRLQLGATTFTFRRAGRGAS